MGSTEKDRTPEATSACLREGLERHESTVALLRGESLRTLARLVDTLHGTLEAGGKVLACGNGGSAADAQHFAGELVGRYREERRALPGLALNADGPVLTCLANDYEYAHVFARQVEALGRPGDLLLALSTSGRSPNIVEALRVARARNLTAVAFLGRDGGDARGLASLEIIVPSQETARIQECHGLMLHLLCEALDLRLKGPVTR
ncbi:MAG TPA: SIS domain-containing protein [Candidatus Polarisedimenticolia bacterium]